MDNGQVALSINDSLTLPLLKPNLKSVNLSIFRDHAALASISQAVSTGNTTVTNSDKV